MVMIKGMEVMGEKEVVGGDGGTGGDSVEGNADDDVFDGDDNNLKVV